MPILRRIAFTGNVTRQQDLKALLAHGKLVREQMEHFSRAILGSMREYEAAHGRSVEIHGYGTGGPFGDHIPVDLFLAGEIKHLTLNMPTEMRGGRYNTAGSRAGVAMTLNQSHTLFGKATGKESLDEIDQAVARGAEVRIVTDLRERFGAISQAADTFVMFAFSQSGIALDLRPGDQHFSDAVLLKLHESSSEEAWRQAKNPTRKIFVNLNQMLQSVARRELMDLTLIYANTPFDRMRRMGVRAQNTFEAILEGGKTAITRYHEDVDYPRMCALKPGDKIGLMGDFSMQRRSMVIAQVTAVREVDLARMDEAGHEAWSKIEGWALKSAPRFGEHLGKGLQVEFRVIDVPNS